MGKSEIDPMKEAEWKSQIRLEVLDDLQARIAARPQAGGASEAASSLLLILIGDAIKEEIHEPGEGAGAGKQPNFAMVDHAGGDVKGAKESQPILMSLQGKPDPLTLYLERQEQKQLAAEDAEAEKIVDNLFKRKQTYHA